MLIHQLKKFKIEVNLLIENNTFRLFKIKSKLI